jgi:hypothetical protein
MRLGSGLVLAGLCLGLCACAAGPPVEIAAAPPAPASPPSRPHLGPMCHAYVADVSDLRPDKENMGEAGIRVVHSANAAEWVRAGLGGLEAGGAITVVGDPAQADVELKVQILKAYVFTPQTAKAATVVLRVNYAGKAAPAGPRTYRGSDTTMDWANGDGEMKAALDRALAQAVGAMRIDISPVCPIRRVP